MSYCDNPSLRYGSLCSHCQHGMVTDGRKFGEPVVSAPAQWAAP